jgi:hypothetical protein
MDKWLYDYERRRTGKDEHVGWTSSRYDLESKDWDNIREIFIPELQMTFGQASSALKRSWYAYRRSRKEGSGYNNDLAWRINRIQHYLGIPLTEFQDGPDLNWIKQQLNAEEESGEEVSAEEIQLRKEEMDEELAAWGLDSQEKEEW